MLGRATAGMRFLVFGTIPLGALLAGYFATALGTRNALWIILASYALSGALLLTPAMLSHRYLPGTDAAAGLPRRESGRVDRVPGSPGPRAVA